MSKYIYILFSPLFINGSISNACMPVAYSTHLYTFSLVSTSRTNWAASQLCSRVRHGSFIYCDFELLQSHLVRSPPPPSGMNMIQTVKGNKRGPGQKASFPLLTSSHPVFVPRTANVTLSSAASEVPHCPALSCFGF